MTLYIVGLIIFILLPSVLLPAVVAGYHFADDRRGNLAWSLLFAMFMGVCGYCFRDPASNPDMVRYMAMLGNYYGKPLIESFNQSFENLYAIDIWFHIISLTGNKQLLPASVTFIFYLIVFYVVGDFKNRFKLQKGDFALLFFWVFWSLQYAFIINSFRSYIAYAMIIFAFYRIEIQKKRDLIDLFLLICPLYMHFSSALLLVLGILAKIITKMKVKPWPLIVIAAASMRTGIFTLNQIMQGISGGGVIGQLKSVIGKAENYYSWNQGGWVDQVRNSGLYTVARIFCAGIVAFTLYVLFKEWLYKDVKEYREGKENDVILKSEAFSSFMIVYLLFTAQTFMIAAPECFRFVFPILPYIGMVYMEATMGRKVDNDDLWINRSFLALAGMAGIVINVYNMNTMIPVGEYLINIFTTGIVQILGGV